MERLIEIRCTCTNEHGKHPLLCKVGGSQFIVEVKCKRCRKLIKVRYPDPLGIKPRKNPLP